MGLFGDLFLVLFGYGMLSESVSQEPKKEVLKINEDINSKELSDKEYYNAYVEAFCYDHYCRILKEKKEIGVFLTCREEKYLKESECVEYVYPEYPQGKDFINLWLKERNMDAYTCGWLSRTMRPQDEIDNPILYFKNQLRPIWFKLTSENRENISNLVLWQEELNELKQKQFEDEWN